MYNLLLQHPGATYLGLRHSWPSISFRLSTNGSLLETTIKASLVEDVDAP